MFVMKESLLEVLILGTIMYVGMFAILRIFRRQSGTLGIADLLVIVVIADAAQNGMAGDSKSITEAMILIVTIVIWDWAFDWLGYNSTFWSRILEPKALPLIVNGKILEKNLAKEMITVEELTGQLRQQGIEDISTVKRSCLESNGHFSVILDAGHRKKQKSNEK